MHGWRGSIDGGGGVKDARQATRQATRHASIADMHLSCWLAESRNTD